MATLGFNRPQQCGSGHCHHTTFCIGTTIASLYGGALAKPQERWPRIFGGEFWTMYPYFLPVFGIGVFHLVNVLGLCDIHEGVFAVENEDKAWIGKSKILQITPPTNNARPILMLTLLKTYSVIPIANYVTLGFVKISVIALLPLFYSSPIEIGGLGLSPSVIGISLTMLGIVDGSVQALFATNIMEWIGAKSVLLVYSLFLPADLPPVMSAVVMAQEKVGPLIWVLLVVQLLCMVLMDLSYTAVFIVLTSLARVIGSALTTSLFAVSKEYNVRGGNLVYVILATLAAILVVLSQRLPDLKDEE
ncbi:hypothetical protein HD554DRAFT_2170112 [Boletus coccyginus]|nr:hypothetical protein HD554DRAFT_2170112 [Boletus coccyginus]